MANTANNAVATAIEEIVRRLITQYRPERNVLFGSCAVGQADEDSDIDLLIIKETPDPFLRRLAEVRQVAAGAHYRIPFEPIVLTSDELEQRLKAGDQFIAQIIEEGEVLYKADHRR